MTKIYSFYVQRPASTLGGSVKIDWKRIDDRCVDTRETLTVCMQRVEEDDAILAFIDNYDEIADHFRSEVARLACCDANDLAGVTVDDIPADQWVAAEALDECKEAWVDARFCIRHESLMA
ncbi:hypothetical protein [Kordiimonas sp.]|uniref:hypothetical protein n=1 Tax=Kordiimonas sp. TaxID=1970157 RepID=UPI003A95AC6C